MAHYQARRHPVVAFVTLLILGPYLLAAAAIIAVVILAAHLLAAVVYVLGAGDD